MPLATLINEHGPNFPYEWLLMDKDRPRFGRVLETKDRHAMYPFPRTKERKGDKGVFSSSLFLSLLVASQAEAKEFFLELFDDAQEIEGSWLLSFSIPVDDLALTVL
ncbi:hypothetical protein SDJN03_17096, partial [Cucurbita argyrosperma subsp. sororia]